jgi:hypothetical protein
MARMRRVSLALSKTSVMARKLALALDSAKD